MAWVEGVEVEAAWRTMEWLRMTLLCRLSLFVVFWPAEGQVVSKRSRLALRVSAKSSKEICEQKREPRLLRQNQRSRVAASQEEFYRPDYAGETKKVHLSGISLESMNQRAFLCTGSRN